MNSTLNSGAGNRGMMGRTVPILTLLPQIVTKDFHAKLRNSAISSVHQLCLLPLPSAPPRRNTPTSHTQSTPPTHKCTLTLTHPCLTSFPNPNVLHASEVQCHAPGVGVLLVCSEGSLSTSCVNLKPVDPLGLQGSQWCIHMYWNAALNDSLPTANIHSVIQG